MIDGHVHLLGTGSGGTGCWLRNRGMQRVLQPFLLGHLGLRAADLKRDFDQLYVERLLELIREAGLKHVLLLAQDEVYSEDGRVIPDHAAFYVPNERVLDLADRHPEFLPAVSIHPARADALDELERCLARGAAAMKCLPNCHNIDPSLPQYRRFWERMAEAGLPMLAHTGGEKVLPVLNPRLADPRVLTVPLEIGMSVIAAHCGSTAIGNGPDYFPHFAEMLRQFPRLYGDNSALSFPGKSRHVAAMVSPDMRERIIHGSDLPVPVQPLWMWLGGALDFGAYRRIRRIRNPLARDIALKRALGFDRGTFTRISRILRPRTAVVQSDNCR